MKITLHVGAKQYNYQGPKNWQETDPACYEKIFEVGQLLAEKPHAVFALPQALFRIDPSVLQFLYDRDAMRMMGVMSDEGQEIVLQQGQALLKVCELFTQSAAPSDWKVPKLKTPFLGKNYYGPGDGLTLLTFEEFWFAEAAYERGDIDTLIGVLYRDDAFRKKAFSTEMIDKTQSHLGRLPELKKEMIAFNYAGCRAAFANQFKIVFPQKTKETQEPKKQAQGKGSWLQLAINMANDSALEFESLRKQNVLIALQMLNNKLTKIKELKAKNPKK
ncbi:hypothetical protein [Runella sp.]|uniref:hypothetical protein n=1 Tax=Runella sp. TaxID=1960881 RepID=UPI003D150B74